MDRFLLSTDGVPEGDRFSYWREEACELMGVSGERGECKDTAFEARITGLKSDWFMRAQCQGTSFPVFRKARDVAKDSGRDWIWLFREAGAGVGWDAEGREIVTQPGDFVIVDPIRRFASQPRRAWDIDGWFLPRALLAPHLPSHGAPLLTHLPGRNPMGGLVGAYLGGLSKQIESLADPEVGAAMDNFCRLVAIACGSAAEDQGNAIRAAKLAQAKLYIDRHLAEPGLTPARVAAALKMSVRQLHLLFEPAGTSFARHVQGRRLAECRAALVSPLGSRRAIADIAFGWGFDSLPTFYRAFQHRCGVAPGELRKAAMRERDPSARLAG